LLSLFQRLLKLAVSGRGKLKNSRKMPKGLDKFDRVCYNTGVEDRESFLKSK
jgi:hypothetical protein